MKWGNIKVNSSSGEGFDFLSGMISSEDKQQKSRKLFTEFIEDNGFTAWHIVNGWVQHNREVGEDVLHHEEIEIRWIESQAGYSHVWRCPDIGEWMIIIRDSPNGTEVKPFNLYCYEVTEKNRWSSYVIKLKLIEVRQAVFDQEENKYQFHIKKSYNIFSFLKLCRLTL